MLPHLTVPRRSRWRAPSLLALTVLTGSTLIAATSAGASAHGPGGAIFQPGDLLVSGSVYDNNPGILTPGVTVLPPGCTTGCVVATNDGSYPGVWDNALADASFGVTSPIFLDQLTPSGRLLSTLRLPDGSRNGSGLDGDHMVTSFSSKSELALNLSTDGRYVTFMGYVTKPDAIDVSNSNTPGVIDPTNRWRVPTTACSRNWIPTAGCGSPKPMPTAATTGAPRSSMTVTARASSTRLETPVTAPIRSRTESSSARARRSSPRWPSPRPRSNPARRPRSAAST